MSFEQWDVVVVPFPFMDRPVRRRRPALVVSRPDALGTIVGQSVLAMITSAARAALARVFDESAMPRAV